MKEAQRRKLRRHEEVIKRILQNAAEMEKAKAFKKVVAKEIPEKKRDMVREGAERLINDLKKLCRDGSLIKLVDMVARKVRGKEYSPNRPESPVRENTEKPMGPTHNGRENSRQPNGSFPRGADCLTGKTG